MAIRIQLRRGTAAEWLTANTTLSLGEMGLETDTGYLKIGDGTTAWANLIYNIAGTALNANNASYLGGIYATDYQKRNGLAANVAKLDANNSSYLGGVAANAYQTTAELANSIVNLAVSQANSALYANSALFSNSSVYSNSALYLGALAASGYQTNAGLAGNVATLAANSATYLGGNTASDLRSYSDTQANSAYSNAISYANTIAYIAANSAYANAISYANTTAYNYANAAYTNAVSYTDIAANAAYSNAITYANSTAYNYANAAYANAVSYANTIAYVAANSAYSNAVSYAASVANSAYANAITYANSTAYNYANAAYTNAISYANTTAYNYANAAYVNAVSYVNTYFAPLSGASFTGDINISGNLYVNGTTVSLNSATLDVKDTNITIAKGTPNAGAADGAGLTIEGANATITYVYGTNSINFSHSIRVGNSTVNSFINSTSFSGDSASVGGNTAADLRDYSNFVANTAYANAVIFANTAANSAYNNAVSYATEVSNAAYTNAVSYADTAAGNAYTTAIAYVNNHILDSVSNSSITYMASANSVKRAYDAAVSAGNSAAAYANAVIFANTVANSAYSNAIAYANSIAYIAANSAYSNAIAYANSIAYIAANSSYINAIAYADLAANSAYSNAVSYAGDVYDSAVAYANTIAYETANSAYSNAVSYADIAANSAYSNAVSYANSIARSMANSAYANAIIYANTAANSAYSNAISYADVVANSAYSNAISYADIVSNSAYSNAISYADIAANSAYANAVSYADIVANAAYTNAVSYANIVANSAYSNAVSYANSIARSMANSAYANAVSYADIVANSAYVNAVSYANTAYANAITYSNTIAYIAANSAYSNAIAYANSIAYIAANSAYANAITYSNTIAYIAANSAYSNAIAYANSIAYIAANTVYTNATSYADIVANSAYNNAVSIAYASSNSAYVNAINYASNASNITTGTLSIDRLPSGVVNTTGNFTFSGVHTHDANLAVNAALILSGSSGTSGQVLTSNGTNNVYWSDVLVSAVTSVDTANGLAGGPITSSGTLYVLANTGIVANSTGTFVNAAYINTISANAATYLNGKTEENLNVNSALLANNSAYLNGQPASYYTNATNISTGTLNTARLPATANISTAINVGANVNLTTSSINVGSIQLKSNSIVIPANASIDFNTTTYKPAFQKGRMYWDNEEQTIIVFGDGSSFEQSMGQREWVRCRNSTASTIPKGTPVYITGVHIPGNPVHGHHPTIAPGDASDYNKSQIIGITGEDILSGNHGYVVVRGYVEEIDTSALIAGERAHLGFATPGTIVVSAPEYPNFPTDLGMCLTSNSTVGTFYVDLAMHTAERFRTTADMYVGGDLSVAGSLRITGNVTSTSVNNLSVKDNLIYLSSGDTIGNTQFTGTGLNDMLFHGVYEGTGTVTYYVKIDSLAETAFLPDTFSWSKDNFATTEATGVTITANYQTLDNGITIKFNDINDHTLNDIWYGIASPINVDLGWVGNYNDTSYKHTGLFRDATDGVYKFFQGYIPEPDAAVNIDTGHVSFELATVQANVFVGNLNGTANNADKLGGVAAASYVTTSSIGTLTANASGYATYLNLKTESNLNVNSALTANASTYLNGKTESNLNVNSALTSNSTTYVLANSGIVSNADGVFVNTAYIATISANAASYLNGKTESNLNVNSALSSNNSTYLNNKTESNLNVNSALTANASTYLNDKTESNLNVNSALTSNSTAYLGGVIATDYATKIYVTGLGYLSSIPASYVQNTDSRTLSGNLNFTGANTTFNSNATFKADIIDSTGSRGDAGQVLASNGSGNIYWTTVTTSIPASYVQNTDSRVLSGNLSFSAANVTFGNSSIYATINSTVYSGSANNTTYVNGKTESNLNVNNATTAYGKTEANLNVNNATTALNANNASYLNTKTESNLNVNNATTAYGKTESNLNVNNATTAYGKTEANLNVNSALIANASTYLNGKTESNLNVNSASTSNNSGYLGGTIATDYATKSYVTGFGYLTAVPATYVQNTDSRTLSGNLNFSAANVTFGNSTVYATINSTVYSGTANNATYLNGVLGSSYVTGTPWTSQGYLTAVPATYVQNTDSRTLSGNLNFTGANSYFSGKTTHNANVVLNAGISLIDSTGSQGTVGQVLASNGTGNVYWSSVGGGTGTVTSVDSGNGLTGGPITGSGSLSVLANSGIVANTTGLFVNAAYIATIAANSATYLNGKTEANLNVNSSVTSNTANLASYVIANSGIVSNSTGVFVNASYIATISANAATYLNGKTESNLNVNNATTAYGKTESNLNVNSSVTSNTANTANYVVANSGIVSNAFGVFVNTAYIATIAANSASYLGTTAAANFVQNTDSRTLSGNLYFTGANSYFSGKTTHNANVVLNAGISLIDSTGAQGTAGQILTSNGSGNVYWSSVSGSSTSALTQTFTGDGSTTNFTLTTSVAGQNNIIVSMNGLVQIPVTHYTISGTTLSFTTAPYTGAVVEARNFENGSSGSGVSVNVNAQYAWSNTQTFTNTITFSTNILVGTSVNAASHTIGTTFVANTITLNSNGVVVNSTAGFFSGYVNASAFATTGNANVGNVNASSTISDGIGNIRSIPVNTQSSAYELANSDNGKCISISSGGVTVNGATIVIGHTSVIFNNSGSTQTITIGTGGTMYLSGNSTSANRTLAVRGVCTVLMVASNTFIISGSLT